MSTISRHPSVWDGYFRLVFAPWAVVVAAWLAILLDQALHGPIWLGVTLLVVEILALIAELVGIVRLVRSNA